jgi:hypothetical protein
VAKFSKETFSAVRGKQISEALIKRRSKPTEVGTKIALDIQRDFKFPGDDDTKPEERDK